MEKASVLVLIVEDHPDIMDLLQDAFEHGGFVVLPAKSAEAAISAIDDPQHQVRALVTDIRLGSTLCGWDVARRAREKSPELPVVYTTGSEGSDWPSLGVPNSILVTKPFAPSQVLTAVSQLLIAAGTLTARQHADS